MDPAFHPGLGRGRLAVAGNLTVDASHIGLQLDVTAGGVTITLPNGTLPDGSSFIVSSSGLGFTPTITSAATIHGPNAGTTSYSSGFALDGGGTVIITASASVGYFITAGCARVASPSGTALSVFGRSANTAGVPADIAAANDGEVLRRSGTAIGFGTLTLQASSFSNYAEGTFTPTVVGTVVAGANTYTTQVGLYTRIGNTCLFTIQIVMATKDAAMAGFVNIAGLPFACSASAAAAVNCGVFELVTLSAAGKIGWAAEISTPNTQIIIHELESGAGVTRVPVADIAATCQLCFSGNYQIA